MLVLPLLVLATMLTYLSGCKDDTTSVTPTTPNPNVRTYSNVQVYEDFGASSYSGVDLYNGTNVLSLDPARDIEMADSVGQGRDRFYIRSGTGDVLLDNFVIGKETKFAIQFSSRNMTQAGFDTTTKIVDSDGHLDSNDFTSHSTNSFGKVFTGLDYRVYGVFLKERSAGLPKPVYGLMYLKSLDTLVVSGNMSLRLTFDVKLNTNGENDFRQNLPIE
jgi:hypothetical protein